MVMLRKMIRLVETALFYKFMYINDFVVLRYEFIISGFYIVEFIGTALSLKVMRRMNLTSTDVKSEY